MIFTRRISLFSLLGVCIVLVGCMHTRPQVGENTVNLPEPQIAEETDEFIPTPPDEVAEDEDAMENYTFTTGEGNELILEGLNDMTLITSPVVIKGMVPSSWVFEGIFPITLLTARGEVVKEWYGEASIFDEQGEIVKGSVPFTSILEFDTPTPEEAETGKLRFASDDTGLGEPDFVQEVVEVQVLFE